MHQGVPSKLETYEQIADSLMLDDEQVAYMGDDIVDLAVLARVGLSAAPGRRGRRSPDARRLGQPVPGAAPARRAS